MALKLRENYVEHQKGREKKYLLLKFYPRNDV